MGYITPIPLHMGPITDIPLLMGSIVPILTAKRLAIVQVYMFVIWFQLSYHRWKFKNLESDSDIHK